MIAEYRALRTSVLVLWKSSDALTADHQIADIVRFNEAVDQAIAESVVNYTEAIDAARNVFLGILGHDLRTPLGAILLSADVLLGAGDLPPKHTKNVTRIYTSVKRSLKIVGDLLDFARTHAGTGMPVRMESDDLVLACDAVVEEAKAFNPERQIVFQSESSVPAPFDRSRMEQVIANLIGNAIEHGEPATPVTVGLKADEGLAVLTVHNVGRPISECAKASLFNPMVRHIQCGTAQHGPGAGLGLGLYIASAIVEAHQGSIDVESSAANGTTFTVRIPLGIQEAA